ncbi:MAG TPA: PepSY domain-containing protein [Bradyrhizobium sp.]|nr:PepSY domain-containing protein [Bradyrhizobium sp.]
MSTHLAQRLAGGSVLLALWAALLPPPAFADLSSPPATASNQRETDAATDERVVRRLIEQFQSAELTLNQAIRIAEKLHTGSRTVQISFEISDPPAYRVKTVKNDDVWENVIDSRTGNIAGDEMTSSLMAMDEADRDNIIALRSTRQCLADAVVVGERAASGKALGGGLMNKDGKLNFVVVVASGGDLKQVTLEPPRAGRRSGIRRSHTSPPQGD